MTLQAHKKLLLVLCVACAVVFTGTLKNPVDMARNAHAAQQAKDRQEAIRQQEEAERQRVVAEAEQLKKLQEKRATMPPFSFSGFTLADSPQQIVEKGLKECKVATSFPVQQSGNALKIIKNEQNFGSIRYEAKELDAFFSGLPSQNSGYWLGASADVLQSGFRVDAIDIQMEADKWGVAMAQIKYYYYTIPGSTPKVLYMTVAGKLVEAVPDVFRERYGEPTRKKFIHDGLMWFSNTEVAIWTRYDLYVVSKAAYDEYRAYAAKIDAKVREEKEAKIAAEDAARKAKI